MQEGVVDISVLLSGTRESLADLPLSSLPLPARPSPPRFAIRYSSPSLTLPSPPTPFSSLPFNFFDTLACLLSPSDLNDCSALPPSFSSLGALLLPPCPKFAPSFPSPHPRLPPVGTGAVGAFYGSRLALAPNALVSVTCRSNYSAVLSNGLQLRTHSYGDYHFTPHAVFPSISAAAQRAEEEGRRWDYVVVATKALPDVSDDSALIAPVMRDESTSVVLIQNGVGVEAPHRARFPNNPVLSAVTVVSAAQVEPGVIKQNRWTRISVGPFVGEGGSAELRERSESSTERFVRLLKEGGVDDAEVYDEVGLQLVRWHKLAVGRSLSPRRSLAHFLSSPCSLHPPSTKPLQNKHRSTPP